jgi:hypothetical protein
MQIMEAVSLSFDDFDLIIHLFQDSRMNRVIAMIQDPYNLSNGKEVVI